MDELPSNHWHLVPGSSNPVNCASRGLYPAKLANHIVWWEGPSWRHLSVQDWPSSLELADCLQLNEDKPLPPETTLFIVITDLEHTFTQLSKSWHWLHKVKIPNGTVLLWKLCSFGQQSAWFIAHMRLVTWPCEFAHIIVLLSQISNSLGLRYHIKLILWAYLNCACSPQ